jgi:hypothetical protein
MTGFQKLSLSGVSFIVGVIVGVCMPPMFGSDSDNIAIGDCVREMGHSSVEKVVNVTKNYIETERNGSYYFYNKDKIHVNDGLNIQRLVKVRCD